MSPRPTRASTTADFTYAKLVFWELGALYMHKGAGQAEKEKGSD